MDVRGINENSFRQFVLEHLEQVLPPGGLSTPKRYAVYLPSSRKSFTDAIFTSETGVDAWDLTRPESTASQYSRSSARSSMRESLAWLASNLPPAGPPFISTSMARSPSAETSSILSASSETATQSNYTCLVEQDLRVRYTPSSHGAFLDAVRASTRPRSRLTSMKHEEAVEFMRNHRSVEEKGLYCLRPGCSDKLRDIKALTSHLHIHNMTDT